MTFEIIKTTQPGFGGQQGLAHDLRADGGAAVATRAAPVRLCGRGEPCTCKL